MHWNHNISPAVRICSRILLLVLASICFPLILPGQQRNTDGLYSIIGQTFYRFGPASHAHQGAEVFLTADADTLHTITDIDGKFTFSVSDSKQVTLYIPVFKNQYGEDALASVSGTFELMPGENLVLIPLKRLNMGPVSINFTPDNPIVTMEGDTWVYHLDDDFYHDFGIQRLKQLPGVTYNARRKLIYISGEALQRTFVNGSFYVFGLKP